MVNDSVRPPTAAASLVKDSENICRNPSIDHRRTLDGDDTNVARPRHQTERSLTTELVRAARQPTDSEVMVKAPAPQHVLREAKAFVGGYVVEVPAKSADTWLKARWAGAVKKGTK